MARHITISSQHGAAPSIRENTEPQRVEPAPSFVIEELWRGPASGPQVLSAPADFEFAPEPHKGGAAFRIVTFPPGLEPHLHQTNTTDLVAVIVGEPTLVLGGGDEMTLRPGDTIVQCGTTHGWRNATDQPATIAVALLSARAS